MLRIPLLPFDRKDSTNFDGFTKRSQMVFKQFIYKYFRIPGMFLLVYVISEKIKNDKLKTFNDFALHVIVPSFMDKPDKHKSHSFFL